MKELRTSKGKYVLAGLISGLVFALLMALFDVYNEEPFSIWKFVFFFMIFGLFNGVSQYWAVRKG